jgi:hypothetical protein
VAAAKAAAGSARGKLVDTLSEREKAYYQKLIDKGHHKDWKEVEQSCEAREDPTVRRRQERVFKWARSS